jgi:hypothetical protein
VTTTGKTAGGPSGGAAIGRPRAAIAAPTLRRDRWRIGPIITGTILIGFVIYGTWAAFRNSGYYHKPYISPFYSPCISDNCLDENSKLHQIGTWYRWSPALLVLIWPLGFRLTCYYYRKAYYRSVWQAPTACAVREPHKRYTGESRFPLILQNIHRFFWYVALIFAVTLSYDVVRAFIFWPGQHRYGMGLGTLIMLVNVIFIWLYTVSCHSCRHILGGRLNHFSRHPIRYRLWGWVSRLNKYHNRFAWVSLVGVAFVDFYIWLVATGRIHDPRFF